MTSHHDPLSVQGGAYRGSLRAADPMSALEVMRELVGHSDAEVTVKIAGTMVDVIRVFYDPDRDKFVLHLHPDDLDDALRRLFRRTSNVDQAAERAAGERESKP